MPCHASVSSFVMICIMAVSEAFSPSLSSRGLHSMQEQKFATSLPTRHLSPPQLPHLGVRQCKTSGTAIEQYAMALGEFGSSGNGRVVSRWWGRNNVEDPDEEEKFSIAKVSKLARAGMLTIGGDACEKKRQMLCCPLLNIRNRLDCKWAEQQEKPGCDRLFLGYQHHCLHPVCKQSQLLTKGALLEAGAKITTMILYEGQYYRLITPIFLHGSISHILVNCFSLNAIGPSVPPPPPS
eukprot:443034-Hanusia_phi.AAC.3